MAKQLGVIQFSGRVGEVVGRKKVSTSSINANIVSKFTAPSNPKSQKQAEQRAAFAAAKNFRDGFANLLNHAFQGVKYGQPSLNRFTKLVTLRRGADYDYLPQMKGTQQFIPQPWPLSRGSIAVDTTPADMNDNSFTLPFTALEENGENVGDFWAKFLAKNPFFINGDMITIVAIVTTASSLASDIKDMKFLPVYDRMVIDSASEEALTSNKIETENGVFNLAYDMATAIGNSSLKLMGVGIIVSRQNGDKAAWLRSNSDMVVRSTFTAAYRSAETIDEAISSYMAATGNVSSDWYLNQTGDNEGTPSDPIDPNAIRQQSFTVTVDDEQETYNNIAFVEKNGRKILPYVSETVGGESVSVLPKKGSDYVFDFSDQTAGRYIMNAALTSYYSAFNQLGVTLISWSQFNAEYNSGGEYTKVPA